MMDLSIEYLGLQLRSPLVASAGPLQKDIGNIRQMEEAGLAAIVLHSLFEEQIELEALHLDRALSAGTESFFESLSYFPDLSQYNFGPDAYLEHIRKAKEAVGIPIIASLNGITPGGWVEYARAMEQAGADAIELNIYDFPTSTEDTSIEVERRYEGLVIQLRDNIRIPIAVKLSPYFTSLPNFAQRLDRAGIAGLVLFNRYYQTDFDIEELEVFPNLHLSERSEILLRLHWTGVLYGRVTCSLAVTGGVHSHIEAIKSVMAGASAVMMTSCLLQRGISYARQIGDEMARWLEEHEYVSVGQMRGNMGYRLVRNKSAFERANYMKVLSSYALR